MIFPFLLAGELKKTIAITEEIIDLLVCLKSSDVDPVHFFGMYKIDSPPDMAWTRITNNNSRIWLGDAAHN